VEAIRLSARGDPGVEADRGGDHRRIERQAAARELLGVRVVVTVGVRAGLVRAEYALLPVDESVRVHVGVHDRIPEDRRGTPRLEGEKRPAGDDEPERG
jgi:hypothetical protein